MHHKLYTFKPKQTHSRRVLPLLRAQLLLLAFNCCNHIYRITNLTWLVLSILWISHIQNVKFWLKINDNIDNAVDKYTSNIQTVIWASQFNSNSLFTSKNSQLLLHIIWSPLMTEKIRGNARYQISNLPIKQYTNWSTSLKNTFQNTKPISLNRNYLIFSLPIRRPQYFERNKLLQ